MALALGVAVDLLFTFGGEDADGVEFLCQVELAGPDLVVLRFIHAQGHEFEVGDDVVRLRADGPGDYLVNGELVAGVGAAADGALGHGRTARAPGECCRAGRRSRPSDQRLLTSSPTIT